MIVKSSAKDTDLIIEHDGHIILSIEAKEISVTCDVVKLMLNSAEVQHQVTAYLNNLLNK